jgi:predicted dehydrogenase
MECSIWFSKAALGYRNGLRIRIFGELASAEWHQMDPEFITFHDNRGHKRIIDRADVEIEIADKLRYNRFKSGHPAGFIEAFANLYTDIADSLQDYKKSRQQQPSSYVFSARDALEGLVMMEAIARSSRDRCWVKVNTEGL